MAEVGPWLVKLIVPQALSMNDPPTTSMGARHKRRNLIKDIRYDTAMLVREARVPTCERVRVTLIFQPPDLDYRGRRTRPRRDPINLTPTLKVVQDGIVDAKVVPDDTPQYMESPLPLIDVPAPGSDRAAWHVFIERLA